MKGLKDRAMKTASQLLGSAPAAGLLAHPAVQEALRRVMNLPTEVRDVVDEHVASLAKRFDLVTNKELKRYKRTVRELENQVASLEHELAQQRRRSERAEGELEAARKDAASARKAADEATRRAAEGTPGVPLSAPSAPDAAPAAAAPEVATLTLESPQDADAAGAAKKPARSRAGAKKAKKADDDSAES